MCATDLPQRRRLRLSNYDYAEAAPCFITICVGNRERLFGSVESAYVRLSEAGRMIEGEWLGLPSRFVGLKLDQYVVMPDHFHGIMMLGGDGATTVAAVLGAFKSITTLRYSHGVRDRGWPAYDRHLWQRSYYDHLIRNDTSLAEIREYIQTNPIRWAAGRGAIACP